VSRFVPEVDSIVRKYDAGGLGLNAGHFAQLSVYPVAVVHGFDLILTLPLVALMCLAQIAYQFYLYP
jgi:hypothetical protein